MFCMSRPVQPLELTVLFTAFIAATYGFGVYLFASLLPDMRSTLGFSYSAAGGMTALAHVGLLGCASFSAGWVRRWGAERVVVCSVLVCCLGLGTMAAVRSTWQVALVLLCMGGAAAAVWVPMVAVVQRYIAVAHQGKALGLMSSGTAYGVLLNGVLISHFMPVYGWRAVWILLGLLTALLLVWGALRLLKGPSPPRPERLSASQAASTEAAAAPHLLELCRRPLVLKLLAIMFMSGLACMPSQNMLSAYLREELGYDVAQVGMAWSVIGMAGMAGGFAMGALADWISARASLALTFAMLTLSALAFLLNAGVATVYLGAALFGVAFNAIFGLVPTLISLNFVASEATRVFACATVLLGVGSMLGNALGGLLRDWTQSFAAIYAVAFGVCLLLLGLALSLPRVAVRGN